MTIETTNFKLFKESPKLLKLFVRKKDAFETEFWQHVKDFKSDDRGDNTIGRALLELGEALQHSQACRGDLERRLNANRPEPSIVDPA